MRARPQSPCDARGGHTAALIGAVPLPLAAVAHAKRSPIPCGPGRISPGRRAAGMRQRGALARLTGRPNPGKRDVDEAQAIDVPDQGRRHDVCHMCQHPLPNSQHNSLVHLRSRALAPKARRASVPRLHSWRALPAAAKQSGSRDAVLTYTGLRPSCHRGSDVDPPPRFLQ